MDKKHVVIIQYTTLAENYGLSTYLRNIVIYLSKKRQFKISLILLEGIKNKANCPKNVDLYEIPGSTYSLKNNANFIFKCLRTLLEINKRNRIDIIHCLYPNSSVFAAVLYKLTLKKVNLIYDLRSPWLHVSVERGSINKTVIPFYLLIGYLSEFIASFFVDKFIFITKGLYDFYRPKLYLGNKPIQIVPSGINVSMFKTNSKGNIRKKYDIKDSDYLIGYVGAISQMRDLDVVIDAVSKSKENLKLMFVGDGDASKYLKAQARELKVSNKVIFAGRVPFEKIPSYINSFDAGICQLRDTFVFRQSYPMKILEYLAAGLTVLANDIKAHLDIAEVFSKEVMIYSDSTDLAKIIKRLKIKNKVVSNNIYNYDWAKLTEQISSFY